MKTSYGLYNFFTGMPLILHHMEGLEEVCFEHKYFDSSSPNFCVILAW